MTFVDKMALQKMGYPYSLSEALTDFTVVGTLYQMGVDAARWNRLSRICCPEPAKGLAQEVVGNVKTSLFGRVVYLSSLCALAAGFAMPGLVGVASVASLSLVRAGIHAGDEPIEQRVKEMR